MNTARLIILTLFLLTPAYLVHAEEQEDSGNHNWLGSISAAFYSNANAGLTPEQQAQAAKRKVDVFVMQGCTYCSALEKFLTSKEIPYTRYDIERDQHAFSIYQQLGGNGVPLTVVGKRIIQGYKPGDIIQAYKYGY